MTLTIERAKELALHHITLNRNFPKDDFPIIIDSKTIELEWCWVFYYNGKKFIETDDDFYSYMGNAPLLVDKFDETVNPLWNSMISIEQLINDYRSKKEYSEEE